MTDGVAVDVCGSSCGSIIFERLRIGFGMRLLARPVARLWPLSPLDVDELGVQCTTALFHYSPVSHARHQASSDDSDDSSASRNTQSLPSPKESPQRFILRETEAPKPARTRQRGGDTSRNENDYEGRRWAPKGASTSLASPTLRPRYPRDPRTSLDTLVLGESSSSRSVQIEMHQVRFVLPAALALSCFVRLI